MFTKGERASFAKAKAGLLAAGVPEAELNDIALVTVTMLSKCDAEKSVATYKGLLATIMEYGLTMAEVMDPSTMDEVAPFLAKSYTPCGTDNKGRSIMWINASQPLVAEERECVRAGVLYWMAAHADLCTLREGITCVIATSNTPEKHVGNERKVLRKLQKTWKSMPLRPQALFIVGAGTLKRIVLTALFKVASLFPSAKVLRRVQFVEVDAVRKHVPPHNMPHHLGGMKHEETTTMVHRRLAAMEQMASGAGACAAPMVYRRLAAMQEMGYWANPTRDVVGALLGALQHFPVTTFGEDGTRNVHA